MQVSPVKFLIPHSHSLLKGLIILQSDGYVLILFTILFVAYFFRSMFTKTRQLYVAKIY